MRRLIVSEFVSLDGGFFLVQRVDLDHSGDSVRGVEYIGYDEESDSLKSHFFGSSGEILEYAYELDDDTLRIWYGDGGDTNSGGWIWPGGGYESTMTRLTGEAP